MKSRRPRQFQPESADADSAVAVVLFGDASAVVLDEEADPVINALALDEVAPQLPQAQGKPERQSMLPRQLEDPKVLVL